MGNIEQTQAWEPNHLLQCFWRHHFCSARDTHCNEETMKALYLTVILPPSWTILVTACDSRRYSVLKELFFYGFWCQNEVKFLMIKLRLYRAHAGNGMAVQSEVHFVGFSKIYNSSFSLQCVFFEKVKVYSWQSFQTGNGVRPCKGDWSWAVYP